MATIADGYAIKARNETTGKTDEDVGCVVFGEVTTTDNTPTECVEISGLLPGCYQYIFNVAGQNGSTAGEDVGYVLSGAINVAAAGTVTDIGTSQKGAFEHANSTGCDVAVDVATASKFALKVTGEAATTYNWRSVLRLYGPAAG